jgi:hypothetical protein
MKTVRFIVEIWPEPNGHYTAVANALHIENAEESATAEHPSDAAKQAVDQLIASQTDGES